MNDLGLLVHRLRNTPVRDLIRALERDGYTLERQTRSGGRIYTHTSHKTVVIHYHRGSDTLVRQTLRSVLRATQWTIGDAERLGLL